MTWSTACDFCLFECRMQDGGVDKKRAASMRADGSAFEADSLFVEKRIRSASPPVVSVSESKTYKPWWLCVAYAPTYWTGTEKPGLRKCLKNGLYKIMGYNSEPIMQPIYIAVPLFPPCRQVPYSLRDGAPPVLPEIRTQRYFNSLVAWGVRNCTFFFLVNVAPFYV